MLMDSDICLKLATLLSSARPEDVFAVELMANKPDESNRNSRILVTTTAGPIDKFRAFIELALIKVLEERGVRGWSTENYEGYVIEAGDAFFHMTTQYHRSPTVNGMEISIKDENEFQGRCYNWRFYHDERGCLCCWSKTIPGGKEFLTIFKPCEVDDVERFRPTNIDPEWKAKRDQEVAEAAAILSAAFGTPSKK